MRRYRDPVEVRRGLVGGPGGLIEGPEQLLWRDRLWLVRTVLATWVETGPWWRSEAADAVRGTESCSDSRDERSPSLPSAVAVLAERECWRVEAARGRADHAVGPACLELTHDVDDGRWWLTGCHD